jgi:large subunit ribosomal protein L35
MPKLKTNRAAAKRFRATGKGRLRRSKAYASHLLGHKSPKRKRNLRKRTLVHPNDQKGLRRLLPYL